jgi:hypothetical protein
MDRRTRRTPPTLRLSLPSMKNRFQLDSRPKVSVF